MLSVMKNPRWFVAVMVFVSVLSLDVFGAECPDGSTSADECTRQLRKLEGQLLTAYAAEEKRLVERFEPDYGGLSGNEYSIELVKAFRAKNAAWRILRDKECWYLALHDGMNLSPDHANPVAEACKVGLTLARLKELKHVR